MVIIVTNSIVIACVCLIVLQFFLLQSVPHPIGGKRWEWDDVSMLSIRERRLPLEM